MPTLARLELGDVFGEDELGPFSQDLAPIEFLSVYMEADRFLPILKHVGPTIRQLSVEVINQDDMNNEKSADDARGVWKTLIQLRELSFRCIFVGEYRWLLDDHDGLVSQYPTLERLQISTEADWYDEPGFRLAPTSTRLQQLVLVEGWSNPTAHVLVWLRAEAARMRGADLGMQVQVRCRVGHRSVLHTQNGRDYVDVLQAAMRDCGAPLELSMVEDAWDDDFTRQFFGL